MAVELIDPNYDVGNTNPNMINAIPQYQDMYIFAELTAYRRGRSTIGNNTLTTEDSVVVNFIGNNQNKDVKTKNGVIENPNYLKFTTNWYDSNLNEDTLYETFGMTSIKITVNSSYVPQVNIQFVDVRGMSFFYQEKSPYRILFDFPPPIFTLVVKGYYGMALQYKLHLVKYTSEFRGENGNYVIDAQFIAMTFAPLTDVLFRYAVNFPLMTNESINANPAPNVPPKNTNELIIKIKSLFHKLAENNEQSPDVKALETTITKQESNKTIFQILNEYRDDATLAELNPILWIYNTTYKENPKNQITVINLPLQYDDNIKEIPTDGQPNSLTNRLWITSLISSKTSIEDANAMANNLDAYMNPNNIKPVVLDDKLKDFADKLAKYRKYLINEANNLLAGVVSDSDITLVKIYSLNTDNSKATDYDIVDVYIYIDITNYYVKLYKQKGELEKNKRDTTLKVNQQINNIVFTELGMQPTIYNIFKIILDDVDVFFRKLNETSRQALVHHKNYANQIATDIGYKDTIKEIFSFPLVVKEQFICGQKTEARISPLDISNKLPEQFPEMMLVDEFMKSFYKQKVIEDITDMREKQNEDGSFVWIPITPQDSKIGGSGAQSPYLGTDATISNQSYSIPVNMSEDNRLNSVFTTMLKRFYVLSQSTYRGYFYPKNLFIEFIKDLVPDDYITKLINFTSNAEAFDLSSSIANPDYVNLLYNVSDSLSKPENLKYFYEYIEKNIPDLYSFQPEAKPAITDGNITYYLNKGVNSNPTPFKGVYIYSGNISIYPFNEDTAKDSKNPVDKYLLDADAWYDFRTKYEFTTENILYLNDKDGDESDIEYSRFIAQDSAFSNTNEENVVSIDNLEVQIKDGIIRTFMDAITKSNRKVYDRIKLINNLSNNGNNYFRTLIYKDGLKPPFTQGLLKKFGNIFSIWIKQLSTIFDVAFTSNNARADKYIYNTLNSSKISTRVKSIILLSNYGYTLSPFNVYPYYLNDFMFTTAAAYQCPIYLPAYVGSLVGIEKDSDDYKQLYAFFTNYTILSGGILVFADIHDINLYLSSDDKNSFKTAYDNFMGEDYGAIISSLINDSSGILTEGIKLEDGKIDAYYKDMFSTDNQSKGYKVIETLVGAKKTTLLNFNTITFKTTDKNIVGYTSLKELNEKYPDVNEKYFTGFFSNLRSFLSDRKDNLNEKKKEYVRLIGDTDIMTQCYYSFKNINDKWLSSPNDNTASGDMIVINGNLIDSFAFVDRAMRPIGNTIINPEPLIEMLNDENLSVYSALSQLLSANGFEFFPLQNFMSYAEGDWIKSFKINTSNKIQTNPAFICMFIGGSSSYPTGIYKGNQFLDDGIQDIRSEEFTSTSCAGGDINQSEDGQIAGSTLNTRNNGNLRFKNNYGNVKAFWVNFAQQNQSMFSSIKFDSKEFPETNESIQIMSRIAGDNKLQAPPPKGQNLYNMYENRAYKATVSGLGNVMIQPTQYFQVGNIPMFNGIYLILSVEHNIEPNKMTTTFSGTKVLKYQIPRVLTPSAIYGYDEGNTENTNPAAMNSTVLYGSGAGEFPQTQYNSMYDLKTR